MPEHMLRMVEGIGLIILGLSFAYKGFIASAMGKMLIWTGFLPITIVSPLFTHLPAGKNGLVKEKTGMFVHIIMGPMFLVISALCICAGFDFCNLPGTKTLNWILTYGSPTAPTACSFNEDTGKYSFPMINRARKKFMHFIKHSKVYVDPREVDQYAHPENGVLNDPTLKDDDD